MSKSNQVDPNQINIEVDKEKKRRISEDDDQKDSSVREANHNMNPSTSKQKNDEFNYEEPLNLSIKKQKKNDLECATGTQFEMHIPNKSWGTLHFYERGKQIYVHELIENEVKVDHSSIFGEWYKSGTMPFGSKIENLRDWVVVLNSGFTLRNYSTAESTIVKMKIENHNSDSNRYKIFGKDHSISITNGEEYEIYNGCEYIKLFEKTNDLKEAFDSLDACYIIIGIYGSFMNAVGPLPMSLTFNHLNREWTTALPYWFVLKLNKEFTYLDKRMRQVIHAI